MTSSLARLLDDALTALADQLGVAGAIGVSTVLVVTSAIFRASASPVPREGQGWPLATAAKG